MYNIICEEAWEKGPIASKYCFEENAFKVSEILGRGSYNISYIIVFKCCFEKNALKKFAILFLCPIKWSPSSALIIPQSTNGK